MHKRKRLLVVHPALAPYRINFFNSLNDSFESTFYFFNENLLNQEFDQEKLKQKLNFKCNYLKKGFNISGRSFRYGVLSLVRKNKPDIILLPEYHLSNTSIILYRLIFKKKFKIYSVCDDSVNVAANASKLRRLMRFFQLKYLDGVVLTHNEVLYWYRQQLRPKCKLFVFPIIRKEDGFLKELVASYPIAEGYMDQYKLQDKKVILFVGRLVEVKNLKRLIEAFKIVYDKNKDSTLIIVGSGEKEYALKNLVSRLKLNNSVILPGRFEGKGLLAWYMLSKIFVLPSYYEPFGAVINEALLAGNYTLVSELAGGASLIKEDVNGNTFNPYNLKEMSNLIEKTLSKDELFNDDNLIKESKMLFSYSQMFENFKNNIA